MSFVLKPLLWILWWAWTGLTHLLVKEFPIPYHAFVAMCRKFITVPLELAVIRWDGDKRQVYVVSRKAGDKEFPAGMQSLPGAVLIPLLSRPKVLARLIARELGGRAALINLRMVQAFDIPQGTAFGENPSRHELGLLYVAELDPKTTIDGSGQWHTLGNDTSNVLSHHQLYLSHLLDHPELWPMESTDSRYPMEREPTAEEYQRFEELLRIVGPWWNLKGRVPRHVFFGQMRFYGENSCEVVPIRTDEAGNREVWMVWRKPDNQFPTGGWHFPGNSFPHLHDPHEYIAQVIARECNNVPFELAEEIGHVWTRFGPEPEDSHRSAGNAFLLGVKLLGEPKDGQWFPLAKGPPADILPVHRRFFVKTQKFFTK